jgi:arsenical pump membrane protein
VLRQVLAAKVAVPALSASGRLAAGGIGSTALVLMTASALGWQLGLPTCIAGLATAASIMLLGRRMPWDTLRDISWGVLPLVAGLFVLVTALDHTGGITLLADALHSAAKHSAAEVAAITGVIVAFACNVMNNLPAGLIVGTALHAVQSPPRLVSAALIGVDLGPNLSVTGSLATILWLAVLRREGIAVNAPAFLKLGWLVMPPALVLALAAVLIRA